MNIEKLRNDRNQARKNNNYLRMTVLNGMIDAIQKASVSGKTRTIITDQLVNKTLIKYQKMYQEIIDTCPSDRADILNDAICSMEIIKEYAPQLMTDKNEIQSTILMTLSALCIPLEKKQKGLIMKTLSKDLRGKADMKIVTQIVNEILK